MTTAAVYTRISRDPTGDRAGVKRQEEDCLALVEREGWELAGLWSDNDISAYSGKPRPGWQNLTDAIGRGEIDVLVAWHPDRLTRQPRELEDLVDLVEKSGTSIATVTAGAYDLTTPAGRMVARQLGSVARYESEHKSERLRRKHQELAMKGKTSGGGRRFGFQTDGSLDADEAECIRDAARRVQAGESVRSIAAEWNKRGVLTSTGREWAPSSVRRVLIAPHIAGKRALRGEIVADAEWPAIIDEVTHRRLKSLLTDPARRVNQRARKYLLAGFVRCALCGGRLHARPRADKRRQYVCISGPGFFGCGKIKSLADPLEELIVEAALQRIDSPELAEAIRAVEKDRQGADDLGHQIEEDERALEELAQDYYVARSLSRAAFLSAQSTLEARLTAAKKRYGRTTGLEPIEGLVGESGRLRELWPEMSLDRRRAILGAVLDSVVVGPAVRGRNFFDPARVKPPVGNVVWRE